VTDAVDKVERARARAAAKPPEPRKQTFRIQTLGQFTKDHVPPPFLINRMFQKGYVYSITAPTGYGKTTVIICVVDHIAAGQELHGRKVRKERVLYFAGENPDDIRARFIKVAENRGVDPADMDICVVDKRINFGDPGQRAELQEYSEDMGPFGAVVVDTCTAYFFGDNENDNTQKMQQALDLRTLLQLPGNPALFVLCHPADGNNADKSKPRGGSAFMAEIDGNAYLTAAGSTVMLHRHENKFRGIMWSPVSFELRTEYSDKLVVDGDRIPTVTARPIDDNAQDIRDKVNRQRQLQLLAQIKETPGQTQVALTKSLGWLDSQGKPAKMVTSRAAKELKDAGRIREDSRAFYVTNSGEALLKTIGVVAGVQAVMVFDDNGEQVPKNSVEAI